MKSPFKYLTNTAPPSRLSVQVYSLTFASPLTFAAYEAHLPLIELFLRLGMGGGCIKTMMTSPQKGNRRPRLQEVVIDGQPSLINALGLPGKGIELMALSLKKSGLLAFDRPIGLSLGGHCVQDYQEALLQYEAHFKGFQQLYYELNISCPNTKKGQDLTQNIDLLKELLSFCRQNTNSVISVKLTPDLHNDQLSTIASTISQFDHMMITIGNTTRRTCKQVHLPDHAISIGAGGLSGPSLYPRTLEMISLLAPFNLPLIATGGIDSPEKVTECLDAGAHLVGMATALVMNPFCILNMHRQLHRKLNHATS